MKNRNPIYLLESDDSNAISNLSLWLGSGLASLGGRYIKLDQQLKMFLNAYPTPESLQEKLEPIMDRNPAARKIYTKLEGMNQNKYIWFIKVELLHSYNPWRILGNIALGPISAIKQGTDIVKNKYYTTAGDILNREINKDADIARMYYSPKNIANVVNDKLNDESIVHNIV